MIAAYTPKNEALRNANLTSQDLAHWKYQRFIKDYLRCIVAVDEGVGRILDYLDQSGLADNTIVVYTSDQGVFLGEHGWIDKRWMYEESLRTPLLVRWPGKVKPGSINDDIVSNVDFAETFLDAAGVDVPADMQGRSLVPVLTGHTPPDWRKDFYYQYYEGLRGPHHVPQMYGVTDGRMKLIHYPRTDEWEFFNLDVDPHELGKNSEELSQAASGGGDAPEARAGVAAEEAGSPAGAIEVMALRLPRFDGAGGDADHLRPADAADQPPHFQHAHRRENAMDRQLARGRHRVERRAAGESIACSTCCSISLSSSSAGCAMRLPSSRSMPSASGPSSASTSSIVSTSFAPSLIKAWQPCESRLSTGPGTANTSRPCS